MDKGPVTISYVKTDWDVLFSSGFNYHEVCLLMLIDSLLISRLQRKSFLQLAIQAS